MERGHQFSFIKMSSEPFVPGLNGNPVFDSWKTTGEFGIACSKFSTVDALDIRGRRCAVPAPKSKHPWCGAEEGRRVGNGGNGVEGGGLAPRMMRRVLHMRVNMSWSPGGRRASRTSGNYRCYRSSSDR